jgi:hypothetical protein
MRDLPKKDTNKKRRELDFSKSIITPELDEPH